MSGERDETIHGVVGENIDTENPENFSILVVRERQTERALNETGFSNSVFFLVLFYGRRLNELQEVRVCSISSVLATDFSCKSLV